MEIAIEQWKTWDISSGRKRVAEWKINCHLQEHRDAFELYWERSVKPGDFPPLYLGSTPFSAWYIYCKVNDRRISEVVTGIEHLSCIFSARSYVQVTLEVWVEFKSKSALKVGGLPKGTSRHHHWWKFWIRSVMAEAGRNNAFSFICKRPIFTQPATKWSLQT